MSSVWFSLSKSSDFMIGDVFLLMMLLLCMIKVKLKPLIFLNEPMTFADKAILFNKQLRYTGGALPPGIRIMNPFEEFEQTMGIVEAFYHKYYNDNKQRHLILGINPS